MNLRSDLFFEIIKNSNTLSLAIWLKLEGHIADELIFIAKFIFEENILFASKNLGLSNHSFTWLKQFLNSSLLMYYWAIWK